MSVVEKLRAKAAAVAPVLEKPVAEWSLRYAGGLTFVECYCKSCHNTIAIYDEPGEGKKFKARCGCGVEHTLTVTRAWLHEKHASRGPCSVL